MSNLELLKRIYQQSEAAQSFQPLLDNLSDDIVFRATIPMGTPISGEFHGKEKVGEYFTGILPQVATFKQLQPMEFVPHGEDKVIILGHDEFVLSGNGKIYSSPYASIHTFKDRLITEILIIQDLTGIYEAYALEAVK